MSKKFGILITALLLVIVSILNFSYTKPVHASSWITQVFSDNKNVKVTLSNSKMTNKPVKVTIDATKYNNGDNVILINDPNGKRSNNNNVVYDPVSTNYYDVIYGNKYTITATSNGDYGVTVERKSYFDPKNPINGDPNQIEAYAILDNIDTTKPVIKYSGTYVDDFTKIEFLKAYVTDDRGLYQIISPDGETDKTGNVEGTPQEVPVYKNGKYTFVAVDSAGNKTTTTIKVTNCHPTPIRIDKLTINSKYITGKTLPNALINLQTSNYSFYVENVKSDKNGYFKEKIVGNGKISLNQILYGYAAVAKKYSVGEAEVKVVKK